MKVAAAMTSLSRPPRPWYREPWPWLLMAGPLVVIVAALFTAWLAVSSSDGLVAEDYYRKGLAAGETLARSRRAEELGIVAGLRLVSDEVRIRLDAAGQDVAARPRGLIVTLSHPTRAGIDQQAELKPEDGVYVGRLRLPAAGHWLIVVEDDTRSWRLMGSVLLPAAGELQIGRQTGDVRG